MFDSVGNEYVPVNVQMWQLKSDPDVFVFKDDGGPKEVEFRKLFKDRPSSLWDSVEPNTSYYGVVSSLDADDITVSYEGVFESGNSTDVLYYNGHRSFPRDEFFIRELTRVDLSLWKDIESCHFYYVEAVLENGDHVSGIARADRPGLLFFIDEDNIPVNRGADTLLSVVPLEFVPGSERVFEKEHPYSGPDYDDYWDNDYV